jgi:hypothetical protein
MQLLSIVGNRGPILAGTAVADRTNAVDTSSIATSSL